MIDRKFDNMLKVSTDGRKAALDLTLVGEKQLYDESSKVFRCVGNVIELYRKHPDSTQLIFCDYSTPKGEDFSIYALLKEKLIEAGIPGKEIAFIHSYQTESRKVELFRRFNAGEMKILIGSTFKLGIGANVQVKLRAIHHLDVPWRPTDMVQREGRILRQGNENKNVLIYRYISQGSFDSYCWQILETKQRFISQFLSGSTYQRTASDLENNVLNYAEVKALALSQPLMKELAQKENEIANLRIIIAKENEARQKAEHELAELAVSIPALKNDIRIAEAHAAFLGTVSDKEFLDETHRISSIFTEQVVFEQTLQDTDVSVFGFDISLRREDSGKVYAVLRKDGAQYSVELGKSAEGNSRRIINKLRKFGKTAEQMNQELNSALCRQRKLTAMLSSNDDSYRRKLAQCEHEAEEIRMSMEIYDAGEEWI